MRTSSRCSCSCCGSTTRPTCSSWAAKWRRCTIWSACGARSGCSWAEKQVVEVGGGLGRLRRERGDLLQPSYLGAMSTDGPLRQPIPVARSILWSPGDGGGGGGQRPGHMPFPVFLSQSALTAIHEHVATPARPGQGVLGFLLGDLCECPDTNVSYLVIDAALRLNQAIYGDRTRDVITRLWDRVQEQLETQQAHLIGWYHTHPPLPLSLTEHDVETHEHYFGEPWQVTLLLGTDPEEPAAGFFRAGSDEAWLATPLPFYELLAPESIRPDGKKRSFVTWKNHRAYNPVTPPAAPTLRTAAAKPPSEPKFTPASTKPQPPPLPPPPADDKHELKFLTAAEDMPPPPPAPPPRRHTPPPRPAVVPKPEPKLEPDAEAVEPVAIEEEGADREHVEESEGVEDPVPARRARRRGQRRRGLWVTLCVLLMAAGGGRA